MICKEEPSLEVKILLYHSSLKILFIGCCSNRDWFFTHWHGKMLTFRFDSFIVSLIKCVNKSFDCGYYLLWLSNGHQSHLFQPPSNHYQNNSRQCSHQIGHQKCHCYQRLIHNLFQFYSILLWARIFSVECTKWPLNSKLKSNLGFHLF